MKIIYTCVGHAITMQNSQVSTLEFIKGDFNHTSKNGKSNTLPINRGAFYTMHLHAKSRDKLKLVYFVSIRFKVNTAALQEIFRMREEALFSWHHP